jgi:hypothetical protein
MASDLEKGYSYLREQEAELLRKWVAAPYRA